MFLTRQIPQSDGFLFRPHSGRKTADTFPECGLTSVEGQAGQHLHEMQMPAQSNAVRAQRPSKQTESHNFQRVEYRMSLLFSAWTAPQNPNGARTAEPFGRQLIHRINCFSASPYPTEKILRSSDSIWETNALDRDNTAPSRHESVMCCG